MSVNGAPPLFVNVIDCGALIVFSCVAGKVRDVGDTVLVAAFSPMPLRPIDSVPWPVITVRTPLAGPTTAGSNTTASVHPVLDASVEVQVLIWIANGPVTASDVSPTAAALVFEIVTS
jgi:hypothetical protein